MTWDLSPVFVEFGTFALRYYTLLFVASLVIGYLLLSQEFERLRAPIEEAGDFMAYGVFAVMIGGRLGHVLFYDLDHAMDDPIWVLQVWTGGMGSHGAILGIFIAAFWFCRRRGVSTLQLADLLARPLLLGGVLIRLGAFFNSEGVGLTTDSTWGMRFPRYDIGNLDVPLRYPAQLYESALCLVLFLLVTYFGPSLRARAAGLVAAVSLGLYSLTRFGVEFFKEFQTLTDSPLTMGQYLSLGSMGISTALGAWAVLRKEPIGWVHGSGSAAMTR